MTRRRIGSVTARSARSIKCCAGSTRHRGALTIGLAQEERRTNRKKAVVRVGNLHRRVPTQHKDSLHNLTTALADQRLVIAQADLRIKSMSDSANGNVEDPGKNVRQSKRQD